VVLVACLLAHPRKSAAVRRSLAACLLLRWAPAVVKVPVECLLWVLAVASVVLVACLLAHLRKSAVRRSLVAVAVAVAANASVVLVACLLWVLGECLLVPWVLVVCLLWVLGECLLHVPWVLGECLL